MKKKIIHLGLRVVDRIRKVYWRMFRPVRYGVKGLIINPKDNQKILLIRQSYGNTRRLTLPGGGYTPSRETPEIALSREVREETGIRLNSPVTLLTNIVSKAEGKIDNISIMTAVADSENVTPSNELGDFIWAQIDLQQPPEGMAISNFVREAVTAYKKMNIEN